MALTVCPTCSPFTGYSSGFDKKSLSIGFDLKSSVEGSTNETRRVGYQIANKNILQKMRQNLLFGPADDGWRDDEWPD